MEKVIIASDKEKLKRDAEFEREYKRRLEQIKAREEVR